MQREKGKYIMGRVDHAVEMAEKKNRHDDGAIYK